MPWETLKAIRDQGREDAAEAERDPPVACPKDGTILDVKDGIRHCPFCGYRWPN